MRKKFLTLILQVFLISIIFLRFGFPSYANATCLPLVGPGCTPPYFLCTWETNKFCCTVSESECFPSPTPTATTTPPPLVSPTPSTPCCNPPYNPVYEPGISAQVRCKYQVGTLVSYKATNCTPSYACDMNKNVCDPNIRPPVPPPGFPTPGASPTPPTYDPCGTIRKQCEQIDKQLEQFKKDQNGEKIEEYEEKLKKCNDELGKCDACVKKDGTWTALGCISNEPGQFIASLLRIAFGIGGGVAFLFMVMGAFKVLTCQGNPEVLNEGKSMITSSIAGLLLIIFSIFILKIIGYDILGLPGFKKCPLENCVEVQAENCPEGCYQTPSEHNLVKCCPP